ncbi:MAG: transporter [Caulobacteraceae bacterium]
MIFFFVAVLLCLTCNLANALVSANAASLMGALGVDSVEMAWLPVVFSMTYLSMNLMLVRFRQQFGLRLYAMLGLGGCCAVIGLHVLVGGFAGAIMVHAAAGVAAAPLSSMAVYYMMTAMPKKLAIAGVILALGFEQIPTPLARLISTSLTDYDQWRSIYIFEFGMTALCFGCVGLFRLPASEKSNVFRPLDIISFLLISAGMALVCAVVGMGRAVWWFDRDWLGWALAAAVPLLGLAVLIESRRAHPLLDLKWLAGRDIVRFTVVAVMSRLVFTEQASVIGLLGASGVNNDELRTFSLVLVMATLAGTITSALIFRPNRLTEMAALVVGLVVFAALFDARSTALDRAPQFFASQALIAFSTAMFMGPALLFGAGRVLQVGGGPLASFLVLFVATQNLGGLAGGALLGTFQVLREKANSAALNATVSLTDPLVAARVAAFGHAIGGVTGDAGAGAARGVAILQQEATLQANVLAYNNTFLLVAALAAATTFYLAILLAVRWFAKLAASHKTATAPTP